MATRSFEDLRDLLSGAQPLPETKFVSYSLPLDLGALLELEPLLKENATLKGLRLRWASDGRAAAAAELLRASPCMPSTQRDRHSASHHVEV